MKVLLVIGAVVLYLIMLGLAINGSSAVPYFVAFLSGGCVTYLFLMALGKVKD